MYGRVVENFAFLIQVPPPVINSDPNIASLLQLSESEPMTLPEFSVIADCLDTNGGSE